MHYKVVLSGAQSTSGKREAQAVGAVAHGSRLTKGGRTIIIMTIREELGATDEVVLRLSAMMVGEGQGLEVGDRGEGEGTRKP